MPTKINDIVNKKDFVTHERYMKVIEPLIEVAINRNNKYGSSIEMMDDSSIIDLIMMKLTRTKTMLRQQEIDGSFDEKIYDEIMDTINYLVYICMGAQDRGEQLKATDGRHVQ